MKVRMGVDLDGCLADFNYGYINLSNSMLDQKLPPSGPAYPNTWHYSRAAGIPMEDETKVWDRIKSSINFWRDLPAHEGTRRFLEDLREQWNWEVYFITNRMGNAPKRQTEQWLHSFGYDHPTVLISVEGVKGKLCHALDLTHYIDDKPENIRDVLNDSPITKPVMLRKPWNRGVNLSVPTIEVMEEYITIVQGDEVKVG